MERVGFVCMIIIINYHPSLLYSPGIKPVEIYLIQLFAGLTKYRVEIFIISASFGGFEILSLYSQNVF